MEGIIILRVYDFSNEKELALEFNIPFEALNGLGNARIEDFESLPVNSFFFKCHDNSLWTTKNVYETIRNQCEKEDCHIYFNGPLSIDHAKPTYSRNIPDPESVTSPQHHPKESLQTNQALSIVTLTNLRREDVETVNFYSQ